MTRDQYIIFIVLGITLVLFAWNRWRYDLVALGALLAVTLAGLVSPYDAFLGLGHPAVITVAAVLALSRALMNAGVIGALGRLVSKVGKRPGVHVLTLTTSVALFSGVMNNVGALALLMPVGVWMARKAKRSPSFILMPIAFGSLLGGLLTLIGTPPNIIIASYRAQTGAEPFGMFSFFPVGGVVALCGVVFISLLGWRLIPRRNNATKSEDLFEISAYLAEVRFTDKSKFIGKTLYALMTAIKEDAQVVVVALIRDGTMRELPSTYEILQDGDVLLIEADSEDLKAFVDITGTTLAEKKKDEEQHHVSQSDLSLMEVIVTPGSRMIGATPLHLNLRATYGVNILAVARQGHRLRKELRNIRFAPGDILLVQGTKDTLPGQLSTLGCLPLASRGLSIGQPRKIALTLAVFGGALLLISFTQIAAPIALVGAVVLLVLTNVLSPKDMYKSGDIPILILLGALLTVGQALETTGGSALIAEKLQNLTRTLPPWGVIAVLMATVMLLSNIINNAAAAVLAAPIAIQLAYYMSVSADPFLMAVTVGASCAFLTPIGHQSNLLIMEPGGYKFGDYWRMGLPLSLIVIAVAVPTIMWIWPL